jgi:hypothetical protein
MNNSSKVSRFCFSLRRFMFGLTIGLGVGLATKNIGIGIANGIVFAVVFGAFGRRAKCEKTSATDRDTK